MIAVITLTVVNFFYFFAWAGIGQGLSVCQQLIKYWPRILEFGGFSLGTWLKDNWPRILFTIGLMTIGVLLHDQIWGSPINELTAILAGAFTDRTADMIFNRKGKTA